MNIEENQKWKVVDRVFEDHDNGLRLRVSMTHGGWAVWTSGPPGETNGHFDFVPTTWGRISVLPNEGESVEQMATRIQATKSYADFVMREGKTEADAKLRVHGIGIGITINTQPELRQGPGNTADIMEQLPVKLAQIGKAITPETAGDIQAFLASELTVQKLDEAKLVFDRAGGKSAGEEISR